MIYRITGLLFFLCVILQGCTNEANSPTPGTNEPNGWLTRGTNEPNSSFSVSKNEFVYTVGGSVQDQNSADSDVPALPTLTDASGLSDYLVYAELNNPGLEAAFYRWRSALEQIPQAKALPDPEITYGQYVRQSDMQMERMVELMQPFPWFGTLEAQANNAAAMAQAAQHEYETARLELYRQLKTEFCEFVYLKDAIDIAAENLELVRHFEQVAATKYMTATGTHPDLIRAQIELAELDEVLVSLKELVKPQTARLNAILNRPAGESLPWPKNTVFAHVNLDSDSLTQWLKDKNPDLARMSSMIEAARQELKLAQLKSYPNLGIGVEWTGFEQSGGMSGRDSVMLLFKMNLPIWRESYQAARRQALANVRAASREKENTQNTLAADAANALYELEESGRKIRLYEGVIPKTEQLVSSSITAYQADTIDFLSLIDAQKTLLEYHLNLRRSRTDYQQRLAELEAIVGTQLPENTGDTTGSNLRNS